MRSYTRIMREKDEEIYPIEKSDRYSIYKTKNTD